MSASIALSDTGHSIEDTGLHQVIDELSRSYLEAVPDAITRQALEASSVVRCVTEPLLARAHSGNCSPGHDGAAGRAAVRRVRDARGCSSTKRYAARSTAAWRRATPIRIASTAARRGPICRTGCSAPRARNHGAIPPISSFFSRIRCCARVFSRAAPSRWPSSLRRRPTRKPCCVSSRRMPRRSAMRSRRGGAITPAASASSGIVTGASAGSAIMVGASELNDAVVAADPVAAVWHRDVAARGAASALFCRRWLDRDVGESPSASQAASWVDLKRTYMEMRGTLQWVYTAVANLEPYAEVATKLGFRPLPDPTAEVGGQVLHSVILDMGPGSVDAWLADLVGAEITAEEIRASKMLDVDGSGAGLDVRPGEPDVVGVRRDGVLAGPSRKSRIPL